MAKKSRSVLDVFNESRLDYPSVFPQKVESVTRQISPESANAFRQCVRILAPHLDKAGRTDLAAQVENMINNVGAWFTEWPLDQLALLFYPNNPSSARAFQRRMEQACEAGELPHHGLTLKRKDGALIPSCTASDLCAWLECPILPDESPLRHWVPPRVNVQSETQAQRLERRVELVRDELARGEHGAVTRAARREGVKRQTFIEMFGAGSTAKSIVLLARSK